jgi:ABC-type transport system involved in cytochrome bd biosynthesis fused ATPase/permease subunit
LRPAVSQRMLRALVPVSRSPLPLDIAAFARLVAPGLAGLSLLGAVRWLALPVAAYVIATSVPVIVPLLVGALVEPLRLGVLIRVRRKLRRACLCAFADATLDAPGAQGASEGAAWQAAHLTERVVAVHVPSFVAAVLTTIVLLALSVNRMGWLLVAATGGVLGLGAGLGWAASRRRRPLYAELVTSMRRVGAWMEAASADRGEIRPPHRRGPFLYNVALASDRWSRAQARLEQRRLVGHAALAVVVLLGLAVAAAGFGDAQWLRLQRIASWALGRVADWVVLGSLIPSSLLVARYADAWAGANNELDELSPRPVTHTGADQPLRGRPQRLRMQGLEVCYGGALGVRVPELDVPLGGHVGIVGRNGSGKSTLASAMAGVLAPTSGRVELDGVASREMDRDQIAFVPQEPVLVGELSVAENVRLVAPDASDAEIGAMLARLGLVLELSTAAEALSRGEQRRIALARALLVRSRLLVLDEPDAWLDTEGRAQLLGLLAEVSEHAAVVVVTHRAEIADAAAYVIVLGEDQALETAGPLEQVRARSVIYRRVVGVG